MVKVMRSIVRGPLAPYVAGFAAELLGQGYTRTSAEQHVCFIAHLDRWLLSEGLGVKDLGESAIEQYLKERRAAGYVEYRSTGRCDRCWRSWRRWACCLSEQPVRLDAVEELLIRYRGYLLTERGLAPETVTGYVHVARPFITSRARGEQLDLAGLTAGGRHRVRAGFLPGAGNRVGEVDRHRDSVPAGLAAPDRHGPGVAGGGGPGGGGLEVGRPAAGLDSGPAAGAVVRL